MSSTTGLPKGVVYTHRGAYLAALSAAYHYGYDATTRYLWTLPMFHCNDWTAPWAVTTAGAAPPPSIIAGLEELGITPIPVYGLTETYGPFSITQAQPDWEDRHAKLSRQGVPMIHAGELAVVDPQMNFLPHDGESLGEVVVRGNGVMAEYFKDPDATATAFAGGWYHTGDVGVIDPDGYLRLTDRLKDIIISGGENISSIEVEGVIHAHPQVSDAAVVGVPDDKWGERPVAYIVGDVDPEDLRAHCRERLAGFKVPDRFEILTELPRTATGKIRKNELRGQS
ncbi:AMP-binding protein [Auritidibacter ignavus]|uniref:AMP-binding protein n=1 Tax=Auritidibacter ignavus TaxID=678932 RepID=UPI003211CB03